MDLSSSLEASWTSQSSKGKEKEIIWEIPSQIIGPTAQPVGPTEIPLLRGYELDERHFAGPSNDDRRRRGWIERFKLSGRVWLYGGDGPLPTAVWASIMDTSKGRDKVLKCLQYSLRTYLYLLSLVARIRPLSRWFRSNSKRMQIAVSSLSLTRKCLLLLNPLHPLTLLLSPHPTSARTLLSHVIDLTSALSDDIFTLSRLGIVGRKSGQIADRWANRFWFLTTVMGLWTLHVRTIPRIKNAPIIADPTNTNVGPWAYADQQRRKEKELDDAEWTNRKLLADLAFVSYEVFHLRWLREPVLCFTGLASALISSSKLYDQHWRASLGKG